MNCDDPGFRRLRYARYADDVLLGFTGPKAQAEEIKQRLTQFMRDELHLELSDEKTLITHARTSAATFLGYQITTQTGTGGRKSLHGTIALRVPTTVIKTSCAPYLARGKPAAQPACTTSTTTTSSRPTGPSTGASSSTTCMPATSTDWTGCGGSWKPRCSRHSQPSTTRR